MEKLFIVFLPLFLFIIGCGDDKFFKKNENNDIHVIIPDTNWHTMQRPTTVFTISTAEELAGLAVLVNGGINFNQDTIKLAGDIDFKSKNRSGDLPSYLWTPIGTYGINGQKPFKGTFDGNGYCVKGIYLYKSENNQGFFGYIFEAQIINLGLPDLYVDANDYVGGLVGFCRLSEIRNCYTSGVVKGKVRWVGGLVGHNDGGKIYDCYSKSEVSGGMSVGGFVGGNLAGSQGIIVNSYSTGAVSGTTNVGGFAGESPILSVIENCYYDKETSRQADSTKGQGLTTQQMKQQSSYSGWDFSDTWTISANNYPYLKIESR